METGFIYAIGAAVIWGLMYSLHQKVLYSVEPMTLLFIYSAMIAVGLLPVLFFKAGLVGKALMNKEVLYIVIFSSCLSIIANFLIFSGIKSSNAAIISMIEIAYPFFVVMFSYIIFKATPNFYFFLGGALIFVGSIIIIKFAQTF
jgi:drug/metabolite transporter (DMT)-like permease